MWLHRPAHIDLLGNQWGQDRHFTGGRPEPSPHRYTRRSNDSFRFQNMRTGEFSYDIPLQPGSYELHLYFIETQYGEELGGGELSRTFLVRLNGVMLTSLDIFADAQDRDTADEKVMIDVHPASDGKLHIGFESERGQPVLSAIEVLPGKPNQQLPIRIVAQPNSYTDHDGNVWAPDNYFLGGQWQSKQAVGNTQDPGLYSSERVGNFSYAIPVDPRETYTATLHLAETHFGGGSEAKAAVFSMCFATAAHC